MTGARNDAHNRIRKIFSSPDERPKKLLNEKVTFCSCVIYHCSYFNGTGLQIFPADCPDDGRIESVKDSDICISNWIIPQEISMQNRLRATLTSIVQEVSAKKSWEAYEVTEANSGGIGLDGNTRAMPYSLRPPFHFSMIFDFIVSSDSLVAWQNWYNNDLKSKADDVVNSYKQTNNNSEQPLVDSSMYYANQMTKYMSDHAAEYQKAILANDIKYQKKYNDDITRYQKRIDQFVNKANGKRDENFSRANGKSEDLQSYKKRKTISFRNSSTLRVTIQINEYNTVSISETTKAVKPLSVASSSFTTLFHNSDPDESSLPDSFEQNPDFAMVLLGKWNTKLNQDRAYDAAYKSDQQEMKAGVAKKIPCDKVQTISVFVEGEPQNINDFLQIFNWKQLNSMIVKE